MLIAFSNVKLLQHLGNIVNEEPYIHFDIEADFIVFRPTVGCKLLGVVNKVAKTHIGCLVHGCFNASIPKPVNATHSWRGAELDIDDEFTFEIFKIFTNHSNIFIKGIINDDS